MAQYNPNEFYKSQYVEEGKENLEQRHKIILSLLNGIIGDKTLEVGCGNGMFARKAALKFNLKNIYGIDLSPVAINSACENGIIGTALNIDKEDFPYQDNFFDTIICGEVIEHLLNPDHLLKEIYRVLKIGGYVLITTPNLASWYNRLLLLFGYQPSFTDISTEYANSNPFESGPAGHLRLYTLKSVTFLLKKYNFKIIKSVGIPVNENLGYGKKYLFLVKLLNLIFYHPSVNSGLCLIAKKSL